MPGKELLASADAQHMSRLAQLADAQLAWAARSRVEHGFGWLTDDGVPDPQRPSELWITARMIHVFALASAQGDERWSTDLSHGVRALSTDFRDAEHGGWFTRLGDGLPDFPKRLYDHAFVVLAAASLAFEPDWTFSPDYNIDRPADPFRPFGVTPGHGLEWARLLLQLRTVHDPVAEAWLLPAAISLTQRALAEGWIQPGGLIYTTDFEGAPVVTERFHWGACEALATVASLHAVTGDAQWDDWYEEIWGCLVDHLVLQDGSFLHEVDRDLAPSRRTWSGRPDVYHAYQALLMPRGRLGVSVMAVAQSL